MQGHNRQQQQDVSGTKWFCFVLLLITAKQLCCVLSLKTILVKVARNAIIEQAAVE
jgi:hypothetical protein